MTMSPQIIKPTPAHLAFTLDAWGNRNAPPTFDSSFPGSDMGSLFSVDSFRPITRGVV